MSGSCYLCRKNSRESIFGYFCKDCKKVQDFINIYPNVLEIIELCCFRDSKQIGNKIKILKTTNIDSLKKSINEEVLKKFEKTKSN
jgi:hypothetical protein